MLHEEISMKNQDKTWRDQRPDFPTMAQVEAADHEQLARWFEYMLLGLENDEMKQIAQRIEERFNQMGGMTPEIKRRIRTSRPGDHVLMSLENTDEGSSATPAKSSENSSSRKHRYRSDIRRLIKTSQDQ
jgi:hypothetical protein